MFTLTSMELAVLAMAIFAFAFFLGGAIFSPSSDSLIKEMEDDLDTFCRPAFKNERNRNR